MGIGTIEFSTSLKTFDGKQPITLSCDVTGTAWVDRNGHVYDVALDVHNGPMRGKTWAVTEGQFLELLVRTIEHDYTDEIEALLSARPRRELGYGPLRNELL